MDARTDLRCLFTAEIERVDGSYVVEIPENEIELGSIDVNGSYRFGVFPASEASGEAPAGRQNEPAPDDVDESGPPVKEGDEVTVEIETLGDQGDGIARVGPGYVLIVPETDVGERVVVEITDVRETVGFADVVERKHYYE